MLHPPAFDLVYGKETIHKLQYYCHNSAMIVTDNFLTVLTAFPETYFSVEQNGTIKFPLYFA